jgi:phosphocarrier protein HPr
VKAYRIFKEVNVMVSKEVVVKNGTGLHARPATLLVKKASSFKSDVSIEFNGKKANVKSLIGVLSLAVTKDSVINVIANGDDEALAVEEIVKLIENLED